MRLAAESPSPCKVAFCPQFSTGKRIRALSVSVHGQSPLSVPRTLWSSRHPIRQSRWRRPASPRPRSGERGSELLPPWGGEEARARRWAREPGARDNLGRVEPRGRHILPRKTFTTREEFGCLAVPPEIREMGTTRMVRARPSPAWLRRRPRRCSLAGP